MGVKRKSNKEYTEKSIQKILRNHFMSINGAKYHIENLEVFSWESDFLYVSKSGIFYECEIKISRQDFFNDKKKENKHNILNNTINGIKPNYFYYVVPENLITEEETPDYSGLIYLIDYWPYVKIIKSAPQITKEKLNEDDLKLKEKFYYNYRTWKNKAEFEYDDKITELKEKLNEAKTFEDKKYKYTLSEASNKIDQLTENIKLKDEKINYLNETIRDYIHIVRQLKEKCKENNIDISDVDI